MMLAVPKMKKKYHTRKFLNLVLPELKSETEHNML
jgi:hypothetical protein